MTHRDRYFGEENPAVGSVAAGTHTPHLSSAGGLRGGHLEAAVDSFAQIVDHSPDAICVLQDGTLVYVNAVATRWLGAATARELIGHAVSRFVHPRSLPLLLARAATLRRPGDVSEAARVSAVRLDGSELRTEAVTVLTSWRGAIAHQLILRDLTGYRATTDTNAHRAALVDNAGDAIISITSAGMVTSWNPAAERIYRRPAHRALALPIEVAVGAPVDVDAIAAEGGVMHTSHYAMDGSERSMRVAITEFDNGHVLLCSDESELRRAARNLRKVVNGLTEGVVVVDQNGWLLIINPSARRILGLGPGDQRGDDGKRLRDIAVYDADGTLLSERDRPINKTFATGLPIIGRVFGIDRADGRRAWLSASYQLLHPDSRETSPVLVSFTDITSQRAATELLAHQAAHDVLTGLPNRAHILETVNALQQDGGRLTALLFIDLDDLKTVNDTFGHDVGDTVIQACATRLRQSVRQHDIVGRFAGDEFVALLVGELENGALERSVDRIHRVLTAPIDIPGGTMVLGASIGVIRTQHEDDRDAATLLRDADTAMYAAKASGRRASSFSGSHPDRT